MWSTSLNKSCKTVRVRPEARSKLDDGTAIEASETYNIKPKELFGDFYSGLFDPISPDPNNQQPYPMTERKGLTC